MKKVAILLAAGIFCIGCGASRALVSAENSPVVTIIDLKAVADDKVPVTIDPGAFTSEMVTFYIPETVPGTYSIDNYGKYVEGFHALDYDGNDLPVTRRDDNSWDISRGKDLDKVTYLVNDTYDTENETQEAVFSPAGTNIVAGKEFMLNLHGFVGYFEGCREVPYELNILAPEGLTASTSLPRKPQGEKQGLGDIFLANRYFEVIDNPILYARPNTISFQINDITVHLSIYSPNGVYKATDLLERMQDMMAAQKAFLGVINSTREYNILLHLSTLGEDDARGFGALEHHTSTLVVLPEQLPRETLEQAMVDVVSHEFFHIVTPLNVHSKEVHYFEFNKPRMSKHLWMYEGTTEYFSILFQINQGLIEEADFYDRVVTKIRNARAFNDSMSFTKMSQHVYENPYKQNYANVYEKGALINMSLDILLRELSNGEKGVLWLMKELSATYDTSHPFEDDALIDEIVALTYPEVRSFFEKHVTGDTPIDYNEYLAKVGLTITSSLEETGYFLDGDDPFIDVDPVADNAIFVREGIELNSFFTNLGARGGDVIEEINGRAIDLDAIRPIIGESFGWDPDTEISMRVLRGDEEVVLEGPVGTPMINVETIVPAKEATDSQKKLRQAWLKG
jgi:predicted metalloprotease with PDZ domain